jgi:dynein heavy chain 1
MTGLSVFQIKVTRNYSIDSFDDDLRIVMKRTGCQDEKICFIFDESNVLGSAFLERMNSLLASGEIPGLYEGDEFVTLMGDCRTWARYVVGVVVGGGGWWVVVGGCGLLLTTVTAVATVYYYHVLLLP